MSNFIGCSSKCLSQALDTSACPFPEAEFLLNDGMKVCVAAQLVTFNILSAEWC